MIGQAKGHDARELVDAAFADVVAGNGGDGQHAVDRAHVDDAAAASFGHFTRDRLADQKRAFQVDAQHRVKVGLQHVQKICRLEDAGVVDQHINAAMQCHGFCNQRIDLRFVANIAMRVVGV